jgi:DEAD/DEAH box helicase domain-containing protein
MGISLDDLYSHQVEALRHSFAGKNVVLQTPTASGKSLCYLLPVFRTLLKDPNATALFVFPTKALAFDQRKKITVLAEAFDEQSLTGDQFVWPLRGG